MYLHGLRRWTLFKRKTRATCGCMATQIKVRVCGLGLLPPGLNGRLVFYDSSAEGGTCANAANANVNADVSIYTV